MRLRQVLLNVMSNAVKYNHPGGDVTVSLHTETLEPPAEKTGVRIDVTDTGIGIADSYLPRLFQPFDRLGVDSRGIEGNGVGLALSKKLTTAMAGHITATSQVGVGSTFSVWLPAADTVEIAASPAPSQGPSSPEPATATRTVLYIEDNSSNVALLERIIARRPNWRQTHAALGGLGLELASNSRPDLILLDLHLPDMTGMDVLTRLHGQSSTADIPIVIVSADATPGQITRLRDAGANDYITKPLDLARLLQLLDTIADASAAPNPRTNPAG